MPEKLPNGVYSVNVNDQGLEVYDGLTVDHTTTVTPRAPSSHLEARQWRDEGGWDRSEPETFCGCGLSMNHGNCDTAVDMLKAQFDRSDGGVGEVTQAWYSIWGDVVAFCCTDGQYPMTSSQYADLLGRITDTCGWYVPGTFVPSSIGFDTVGCGYMNYSPGLDFCTNSDSGQFMGRNGRC
ncbi:hypothetical protein FOQG_09305 [Fusarium oxysporum f. sp. raphani 54005]|uniref:Uncharacterized protein n=2 Tax=Fusarium oxysporum TaxID=5507 RepID=X0C7Y2_FUSOX|nr:hypothetical protein FOVG_06631 [Fusarium oxysporum f. sp. pisi HDV247]EXK86939.1 hypothetical protein FOQG_09305 [Fusarium oxysporum f. sp. raphani 54005]WKT44310.1 hypothetical protein QSH57_009163 [Fusarium oxysporum f. sp. vasinfectum]